jgi:hypothetical protein
MSMIEDMTKQMQNLRDEHKQQVHFEEKFVGLKKIQ